MAASFTPLSLPTAPARGTNSSSAPRKPGEACGGASAFQPLADGSKSAPAHHSPAAANGAVACGATARSVTVERDGDQITRIRVQCSCGEVIELDCVY